MSINDTLRGSWTAATAVITSYRVSYRVINQVFFRVDIVGRKSAPVIGVFVSW